MGRRLPPDTDVRQSLRSAVDLLLALEDLRRPRASSSSGPADCAGGPEATPDAAAADSEPLVSLGRSIDRLSRARSAPAAAWQRLEEAGERLHDRSRKLRQAVERRERSLAAIELLARANRAGRPGRDDDDEVSTQVAPKAAPRLSLVR